MNKPKPYYTIEPDIAAIIRGLMEKCIELDLGNCSFDLYDKYDAHIHLLEFISYWELRIAYTVDRKQYMDMHRITDDGELHYQCTE